MPAPSRLALVSRAEHHAPRTAIVSGEGRFSYADLLSASAEAAAVLLRDAGDLEEARVAFLVPSGFDWVKVQWGVWRAGGIAVPLCVSHPNPELEYAIADADAQIVVAHPGVAETVRPLANARHARFLTTEELSGATTRELPRIAGDRRAMILYTSGTTGRPKGVVTTHANLAAQIETLVAAWEWSRNDRILHVLPLHHVHGIVNVLSCALWSGAACDMLPQFDADTVWRRFEDDTPTLFMAVPTIYSKLIAAWERAGPDRQEAWSKACAGLRLMVSGSAALPVPVFEKWRAITGHTLLERYGMTEIGMALSNPLRGARVPGHVGAPLPGVEVRIVDELGRRVEPGTPGEIEVRGPGVFREYWRRPEATREAFRDGWFRTGDVAIVDDAGFRILGRSSVDIIKTGGYKVSALEIEDVLRTHTAIAECAVVGLPDVEWGERVAVAMVANSTSRLRLDELRDWAKSRLAPYKVPSRCLEVRALPRNAMGKVQKTEVVRMFQATDAQQ